MNLLCRGYFEPATAEVWRTVIGLEQETVATTGTSYSTQ